MFIDGLGGAFHLWFGSFVGFQTMKTRVVFNKDTFELKTVTNHVLGLQVNILHPHCYNIEGNLFIPAPLLLDSVTKA